MSFVLFLLLLSSCTSLMLPSKHSDRAVLLKIKEQLRNPEYLSTWVEGFDYCNDSSNTPYVYIRCSPTGRVSVLNFGFYGGSSFAPFPKAICRLTALTSLLLDRFWGFTGPLPSCINKLVNLVVLSIHRTTLSGPLPEFRNLDNLTFLEISNNGMRGPIPASISSLPKLQTLSLEWNNFEGTIPPDLVHLPGASLFLNDNHLTGEIPRCYGQLNIDAIDLSTNGLSGDASFLFHKAKNITKVDLSFNQIYGKVPESLAWHKPIALELMFNVLCGEMPHQGMGYPLSTFDSNPCLCGTPLPPCATYTPPSGCPATCP